ncbi:MAG: hypothetical protein ACRC6E_09070 [Fusobacteriaceae bacterium]
MAIITINDLFSNKKRLAEKVQRTVKLEVEELGGEMILKIPTFTDLMELIEKSISDLEKADEIIYYNSVEPNFSNEKLISELKCTNNPTKVVSKVLSEESRMKISTLLMNEATEKQNFVKIVDEIKN